jgi:uncharacterized protein
MRHFSPVSNPAIAVPLPETTDPAEPAADPEIDAFDAVCRRMAGFDERIDTEWADGYLTALAAGPRTIDMAEWLPAMGGDAFERAFGDPADVAQATKALAARAKCIASELDPARLLDEEDRLRIAPLMQQWDDESRRELVDEGLANAEQAATFHTGAVWADGFFAAIEDFASDWPEPDPKSELGPVFGELLDTVAALGLDPASEEFRAFAKRGWKDADPTRDELIDEACFAVQELRLYWLDHAPKPAPRRVDAAPGRNDPCPCGSGKKYKKCHGASA